LHVRSTAWHIQPRRPRAYAHEPSHHAADLPQDEPSTSLAPGVLAIFDGIRDGCETDEERLSRGFVVCDALYQYCREKKNNDPDE